MANIIGNAVKATADAGEADRQSAFIATGGNVTQTLNPAITGGNATQKGISGADLINIRSTFDSQGFDSGTDGYTLICSPHQFTGLLKDNNFTRVDATGTDAGIFKGLISNLFGVKIIVTQNVPFVVRSGTGGAFTCLLYTSPSPRDS